MYSYCNEWYQLIPRQEQEMERIYLSEYKRVYWYNCDGVDDRGWGCGWRVMQTIASLLFDVHVSFEDIDKELMEMGFDTKNKDGRLAFADAAWITEYFRHKYSCEMKMFVPTNFTALDVAIEDMNQMADPKVIVLITGGMIVCMDAIEGKLGHFIDPHVYTQLPEGTVPSLFRIGEGGVGHYFIPQIMDDVVEGMCATIEDPELRKEIKSSLEYAAPCFIVIQPA